MRHYLLALVATLGGCAVSAQQPGTNSGDGGDAALLDGPAPDAGNGLDASNSNHGTFCGQPGSACTGSGDCCSGECTAYSTLTSSGYCYDPPIQCTANGQTCGQDDDCCSLTCTNGTCAQGCAQAWTDCSSSACCSNAGNCVDNVCQVLSPACSALGKPCGGGMGELACCSGVCTGGVCAGKTCGENGTACTGASDCCTGTCTNGACTVAPQCAWKGNCTSDFQCCTGSCVMTGPTGQCTAPVGQTVCQFLESQPDSNFADCFDCVSSSCCTAEYLALDWAACFQDCMSSFDTWDSWATCSSNCNSKVGPAPSSLTSCVQASCATSCKVSQ